MRSVLCAVIVLSACGRSGFELLTRDGALVDGDGSVIIPGDGDLDATQDPDGSMVQMPDAPTDSAMAMLMGLASFTQPVASTPPTSRRSSGAAISTGTENVYIFGGFSGSGTLGDGAVYSVSGNSWAALSAGPATRERHALAWDATNSIVVMFGGQRPNPILPAPLDELWYFKPGTGWTQIAKAGNWPGARRDHTLVYMPHLGTLLLYGGANGSASNNRLVDTWTLSINTTTNTATWTQVTTSGNAPAQAAGCFAYDATGHKLIVYGGETADGTDTNTTFQFSVDTSTWQQDTTSGTTPAGQSFQECVWDPGVNRVVLYGGQNAGGSPIGGSYAYDPATKTWTTLTENTPPGNRSDAAAVYSVSLGKMLWFGGRTASTSYTNALVTMDLN